MQRALLTTGLCLALAAVAASVKLACYIDRTAAARPSLGEFTPEDIDAYLCTHIIFSSASIEQNNLVPAADTDTALYKELNKLKSKNPQLKTLLVVGGQDFDDQKFTSMVASFSNRRKFINSAVTLLQENGFDGLHLDWLYPGDASDTQPKDPQRFTALCQELRATFDKQLLILSASVAAEPALIDNYDVPAIAAALDFINVLTYDLHNPSESAAAHHSPLRSSNSSILTTESALSYWVSKGAPAAKLNMGIAAYGVGFTLATANSDVGAATSGPSEKGRYTGISGLWSYYETCLHIWNGELKWIPDQSVPYVVAEGQWVGYDDIKSLNAKIAHIKDEGYGGAVVWALDLDDHTGRFCKEGPYPFIGHLSRTLLPRHVKSGP